MNYIIKAFYNNLNDLLILLTSLIGSFILLFLSPVFFIYNLKRNKIFKDPKVIIITGASSGLGRSLAINYSKKFKGIKLGLIGRNKERLENVQNECIKLGAIVEIGLIDIREKENLENWISNYDRKNKVDIVYANAACTELTLDKELNFTDRMNQVTNTNVNGVLNTVLPLVETFRERNNGQFVIISSLASNTNYVYPAYTGSKAFATSFSLTLRNYLERFGVGVSVVCCGYIDTPMSAPLQDELVFVVSPDEAAKITISGVESNQAYIGFSRRILFMTYLIHTIPFNFKDTFNHILNKSWPFHDFNNISTSTSKDKKKNL